MKRDEWIAKIKAACEELKTAGPVHKRDLIRQINRMRKELAAYDRYHREAENRSLAG